MYAPAPLINAWNRIVPRYEYRPNTSMMYIEDFGDSPCTRSDGYYYNPTCGHKWGFHTTCNGKPMKRPCCGWGGYIPDSRARFPERSRGTNRCINCSPINTCQKRCH